MIAQILAHPDFEVFMEQKRIEDLERITSLLNLIEDNKQLFTDYRVRWKKYIYAQGEKMLNDEELAKKGFKAIEDFIIFRQNSVNLVRQVFQNEQLHQFFLNKAVNEGFSDFLNIEPNIVAEYLAKFLDFHLKKVSG